MHNDAKDALRSSRVQWTLKYCFVASIQFVESRPSMIGETDEDFSQTISLIEKYKFPQVHISQFYPRPGTPAARMKKVPSTVVKNRSRQLTAIFEAFTPYNGMEGRVERIWITEIAADGIHLVGHTKGYIQVLVVAPDSMLGTSAMVRITSVGRWSVFAEVIETLNEPNLEMLSNNNLCCGEKCSPCSCSKEADPCVCGIEGCGLGIAKKSAAPSEDIQVNRNNRKLIGWFLRKRGNQVKSGEDSEIISGYNEKPKPVEKRKAEWGAVDMALLGGMTLSFFTIVALLVHLGIKIFSHD